MVPSEALPSYFYHMLGGVGGMPPSQENFEYLDFKWCTLVHFGTTYLLRLKYMHLQVSIVRNIVGGK